ncbi:MAG: hypothetical protein AB1813_04010 [Verrucomicrobiota bacterium]
MKNDDEKSKVLALLERLKTEMPEVWSQAEVVGRWVWLEFHTPPLKAVRARLKELGFHWNAERQVWQNPCGVQRPRSSRDPKGYYDVIPATEMALKEALPGEKVRYA